MHITLIAGARPNFMKIAALVHAIERWLNTPNRKELCAERREKMLSDKMDYAKFLTWFIEQWPESGEHVRTANQQKNTDFWRQFK